MDDLAAMGKNLPPDSEAAIMVRFLIAVMKIQRNLRIVLARRRENEAEVMALLQVAGICEEDLSLLEAAIKELRTRKLASKDLLLEALGLADSSTDAAAAAAEGDNNNTDEEEDPRKLLFELKHAPKHATCQRALAWSTTQIEKWENAAPTAAAHLLWEPRGNSPLATSLSQAFADVDWARIRCAFLGLKQPHEVQQDNAATVLQGKQRQALAKQEAQARREAKARAAAEAAEKEAAATRLQSLSRLQAAKQVVSTKRATRDAIEAKRARAEAERRAAMSDAELLDEEALRLAAVAAAAAGVAARLEAQAAEAAAREAEMERADYEPFKDTTAMSTTTMMATTGSGGEDSDNDSDWGIKVEGDDADDDISDFATAAIPHGLVSCGVPTASEQAAERDRLARQTAAEKAEAEERQREARKQAEIVEAQARAQKEKEEADAAAKAKRMAYKPDKTVTAAKKKAREEAVIAAELAAQEVAIIAKAKNESLQMEREEQATKDALEMEALNQQYVAEAAEREARQAQKAIDDAIMAEENEKSRRMSFRPPKGRKAEKEAISNQIAEEEYALERAKRDSFRARSRPTSAQAHSRPTSAQARKNSRPSSAARIDNRSRSGSAKTRPGTASTTTYPLEQSVQFYNVDGGSRPRSSSSSSSSAVNQANMATPPLGAFASAMNYDDEGQPLETPLLSGTNSGASSRMSTTQFGTTGGGQAGGNGNGFSNSISSAPGTAEGRRSQIDTVGQELNAVAQNLVANPAATSLNYNTCNIRPGRSSSGGGGVGSGGLSLEQGQQMRGGYASSSNYAISPTFARSNNGATSTTFTGVGGGSGAMNLSGLSGTTRDGRPGSPSNSGGVVTPVPPLAFPLDGFNFGGDSCEGSVEGGSSTRDESSLILPPVKSASSNLQQQQYQSSLLSPMGFENNFNDGGSLASGSMDTLVSFPILSNFQQQQQQQQQPLFEGVFTQDGDPFNQQQRPSTSSAVIGGGADNSSSQRASTSPGQARYAVHLEEQKAKYKNYVPPPYVFSGPQTIEERHAAAKKHLEERQKLLEKRQRSGDAAVMSRPHTSSGSTPSSSSGSLYNKNRNNDNAPRNSTWSDRNYTSSSADRFSKTLPVRPSTVQELPVSKGGPHSDLEKRLEMQRSRRRRQ